MTARPNLAFAVTLLLGVFAFLPFLHAAPLELDILRQQYDKLVVEPFETGKADLVVKFSTALENAMEASQKNGHLDELIALQGEQKRLADRLPIPNSEDEAPETLKKLRSIYHKQLTALETKRDATAGEILPAYTTKLKELESTLTKGARIPDALLVKTYREGLAGGPASALPTTMPVATPAPVPATTTPAPRVKGDDRKAAEWVMSNWSEHRIFLGGVDPVSDPAKLPKGEFAISAISIDGRHYIGPEPLDGAALLTNLGGLKELESISLGSFPNLTDADLAFLATLEALETLQLSGNAKISGDGLLHLAKLARLKVLFLSDIKGITARQLTELQDLPLKELKLTKCRLVDADLSGLAGFQKLSLLTVEGNGALTDASLPALRALPALERLYVTATGITPQGLGSVPMPRIINLGCNGLSGLGLKDLVPQVTAAFPNLSGFQIGYPVQAPEDLASLAHFENLEVISNWGTIDESAWPGLLELHGLKRFSQDTSKPIPDSALPLFAQLKKLELLEIGSTPESAALAALRKARPDVKIEK